MDHFGRIESISPDFELDGLAILREFYTDEQWAALLRRRLVTTQHLDNPESIKNLNQMFHLRVSISNYIKPKQPVQCHKCQRISHTHNFCNMSANCVKCGGPHDTSNCKKSKEDDPKCYNCNLNHPSNYRGCQAFISAKQTNLHKN
ncbi:hypothetical protein J437_LFUL003337 [Ladona fulva]|uniref:Nucleic-acid-binding protein from transposon X-element n=1 Tax=Ladona fulva TaxID=123851 RepID=A0A8K0K3L2_LADFU|nr:hypothetical protein J437_LFUL003337 [Ladona fulva]